MSPEEQVEALLVLLAEEVWESGDSLHKALADFLASVRRDAGAEALREAADARDERRAKCKATPGSCQFCAADIDHATWLRDRADLLAGEGS